VPDEEVAVLVRINARSEPFEEAFARAGIPYQVRGGAFLRRPGPRSLLERLRRAAGPVEELVVEAADQVGYDPTSRPEGEEEATRQADLARLRAVAAEYAGANPGGDVSGFIEELERRFSAERSGRGVNLLTYHRAKGLEFEAVFLPRLLDGELPFRSGRATADPAEERRLLYVGITRARRYLFLTWPTGSKASPSPFLSELGVSMPPRRVARPQPVRMGSSDGPLLERLKAWRRDRARADGVPTYVVFHDRTLAEIADRRPRDWADLAGISGIGPAKLDRYADEILGLMGSA
jgi:DNA helicase-2/ATP-dependent DNA helicase PcrA